MGVEWKRQVLATMTAERAMRLARVPPPQEQVVGRSLLEGSRPG